MVPAFRGLGIPPFADRLAPPSSALSLPRMVETIPSGEQSSTLHSVSILSESLAVPFARCYPLAWGLRVILNPSRPVVATLLLANLSLLLTKSTMKEGGT